MAIKRQVKKNFSTVETLQKMLRHREVMFKCIEQMDRYKSTSLPSSEFHTIILKHHVNLDADAITDLNLTFDVDNLLQAHVVMDKRRESSQTRLFFNKSVIDVFRLCKLSLTRPLTRTAVHKEMTSLWDTKRLLSIGKRTTAVGTSEYDEWVSVLNEQLSDLLGKVKTNIETLTGIGAEFEKSIEDNLPAQTSLAFKQESYERANNIYVRQIEPLQELLSKTTRYKGEDDKDRDGLIMLLDWFTLEFDTFGDLEEASFITALKISLLELFIPIKKVSDQVRIYLQKTKRSLEQYNAIETCFQTLESAYNKTLTSDIRIKYIAMSDLNVLPSNSHLPNIKRLTPLRYDKSPAYVNVLLSEIQQRTKIDAGAEVDLSQSESVSREHRDAMLHSKERMKLLDKMKWVNDVDIMMQLHEYFLLELNDYKLTDLFDSLEHIVEKFKKSIKVLSQYNVIEHNDLQFQYRIRTLI